MVAALRFRVNGDYDAYLYPVGTYNKVDWDNEKSCCLGEDYSVFTSKSTDNDEIIDIAEGLDGKPVLRLIETKRYIIKLNAKNDYSASLPVLQNEKNKSLKIDRDENSVTFQFINYLGRTRVSFADNTDRRNLVFEVVPNKMNYEDDYVELTESIAERCSELLLEYSGSTSNMFSMSDEDSRTLLEQFIFMRKFCFNENLLGLFETIKRNPDRILTENIEFKPLGCAMPSRKVFIHPFSYAQKWKKYEAEDGRNHYLPSMIATTEKSDSVDTIANRFLKFALEKFQYLCEELIKSLESAGAEKQTECLREALHIQQILDDILHDRFFDEIGRLEIMPQNNQVLQKRTGYSEIFSAYSMVDLALQLDWEGEESVYEGESKNVALLYEYWLFFELANVIKSMEGCESLKAGETPFILTDRDKLTVSLKEGKQSCQAFVIRNLGTRINLYYNRTFAPTDFHTTKYEGSYSRPFRPDYTLAIFPDNYHGGRDGGESKAVKDGEVCYIHFDAKYRITDLTSFVGKGNEANEFEESEFIDEKAAEVTNTYKRGDLLKMHTYNDAIRRTIGSYILYPGEAATSESGGKVFSLYDEILPGVGAFAIKPSISAQGENELRNFITSLIAEKSKGNSRLNRLKYYADMVLQEPAAFKVSSTVVADTLSKSLCVLGYIRAEKPEDYYFSLVKNNLLNPGKEFLFYYYAIKGGTVYSHHRDIAKAFFFRFYKNNINENDTYELEPVLCEIVSNELISKQDLVRRLVNQGYETTIDEHHADFYYVMIIKVISIKGSIKSEQVNAINHLNGNDSFSPHSPKVINSDEI
jgi:hypothetical protein